MPPPVPAIHADLNGLFALAIGIGYILPYRRPDQWRAYLWLMGPFLKGLGAVLFVGRSLRCADRRTSFLVFAASRRAAGAGHAVGVAVERVQHSEALQPSVSESIRYSGIPAAMIAAPHSEGPGRPTTAAPVMASEAMTKTAGATG